MYSPSARIFKTAWFHKAAKKAKVTDTELCNAVRDLMAGHGDDLGGGVFWLWNTICQNDLLEICHANENTI